MAEQAPRTIISTSGNTVHAPKMFIPPFVYQHVTNRSLRLRSSHTAFGDRARRPGCTTAVRPGRLLLGFQHDQLARRVRGSSDGVLRLGHGPFNAALAARIVQVVRARRPALDLRTEQEATPDALRRVGAHEVAAALVMESPAAARRHLVRLDMLRDEPLLAALPRWHRYASEPNIPIKEFVSEPVLMPREPYGLMFNAWLHSVIRAHGFEIDQTLHSASAPWDRQLPPVAKGDAVSVMVADWLESGGGLVAVPFDPPLNFPIDLASRWPPTDEVTYLVCSVLHLRDAEGWLTERRARTDLPQD